MASHSDYALSIENCTKVPSWVKASIKALMLAQKYQVKSQSSWFTLACSATIAHKNHFFWLYEHDSLDHNRHLFVSIYNKYKHVFNEAKSLFSDRIRHHIPSPKFTFRDYWQLCNEWVEQK